MTSFPLFPEPTVIDKATLTDRCLAANKSLTPQRMLVLDALMSRTDPCSAYDLRDYLAATGHPFNISTIYRILEFWESLQVVHKLASNSTYLICQDEHAGHVHIIRHCHQCAHTAEDCQTSQALALPALLPDDGFQADLGQVIELTGVCQRCAETEAAPPTT